MADQHLAVVEVDRWRANLDLTFADDTGKIFTSSSVDGVTWTTPQLVADQPGAYGGFQSPMSGGSAVDVALSQWNPYGTNLYQIENSDTRGLGTY